ncbi:MAG: LamG domain-containing protein [Comamonadaceae bacterium]|uniref:LamG domain-containing protein n=1 Tax=Candidatus Skiveiella danica TaxID=3386177 RepID=UPI00390BEB13|nr:LamG domain-containing protein [Comamonadaceae bacterium]
MALGPGDPLWYYKVLGLHCDGTNGSTTITDVKGKTATRVGNVQISTAQYPPLTGKSSSLYFDGTGDYITYANSTDWAFGSGDFTVRLWCRPASAQLDYLIHRGTSTGYTAWSIYWNGTNSKFGTDGSITGSGYAWAFYSASTYSLDTWHLVELIRSGTTIYLLVDGAVEGTATSVSGSLMSESSTMKIGSDNGGVYQYTGYMSEIEVYKGAALNTSAYTPSSDPFFDTYVRASGTTKDSSGTLASRLVRVYRRDTGVLVGSSLSNGTTGEWSVTAADSGTTTPMKHFAICFDATADPPGTPTENGLIYDNITPY